MSLQPPLPDDSVTEDAFLGGRLRLRQPAAGYRAAIDPVLLAAAVPAAAGERVADLGCGVATAGLCLLARVPGAAVTGLELQPSLVALAVENAALNGCAEKLLVVEGDVARPPPGFLAAGLGEAGFDHVMLNPPYLVPGANRLPAHQLRRVAMVEGQVSLETWIACALRLVAPGGSVTVIHRADRLERLPGLLAPDCGGLRVFPLWPHAGEPAKRVLVQARKGHGGPLRLLPGLVLHEADGSYTAAAEAVLRDARGLALLP